MHQSQQYVNGTCVPMPPFHKWRRLPVPLTEDLILLAQELREVL
jgi:hypothetical protein